MYQKPRITTNAYTSQSGGLLKCTMTLAKRKQEEAQEMAINLGYLWRMVLPALFIITARHLNEKLSCKSHLSVVNKKRRRFRLSRQSIGGLFPLFRLWIITSLLPFAANRKQSEGARDKQIWWRRTIYGMPKAHKRAVIRFADEIDLHKLCQLNVDTKKRFLSPDLVPNMISSSRGSVAVCSLSHLSERSFLPPRVLLRSQIRSSSTTDFRLQKAETKNI